MKQAGVTLSGREVVTPTIKTTAPGQPHPTFEEREQNRQERIQSEEVKYKDTAKTGAKAGYTFGLQEGGLVGIDYLMRRL